MAKNHSTEFKALKLPYFVTDTPGKYRARQALTEDQIIKAASILLNKAIFRESALTTSPVITRAYLKARLRAVEYEIFACLYLDNQHRVIEYEELFRGTIDGASVYPREVAKRCLQLNAAAVIFAHNHPSGIKEPSQADLAITKVERIAGPVRYSHH